MAEGRRIAALIRHGAYHQRPGVPSALQPHPLTEDGIAQARACGAEIATLLDRHQVALAPVAWSSPQLRAWQTADAFRQELRGMGHAPMEIRETPALSERGLGAAANLTVAEIEAVLADDPRYDTPPEGWKADSDYRLPLQGAESLAEAGRRVAGHLHGTMAATAPGQMVLFTGHGASFRHAACALGVMDRAEIPRLSMHHARPLLLCYTEDGKWQHLDGAWKVRAQRDEPLD